ncbi:hypothetical protein B0H16DRAFT_1454950 [Mycena metata]|uniref:Uncharacterized protein n=1 Tax=Mycena metata TaxID=1033252 RepID=A0AAD7JK18_9AGAR|nr:hypothetical protein B0H16DRAFT_1454950 [Mycena metata]
MASPPRQRVVDDTDPAILYGSNGWFVADPGTLGVGNFGPIYQGTSHATTSSNSTLSFPFDGTAIRVLGTIMVTTDPTTNATDPTWECFVDEIAISNPQPKFQFTENNWILCDQPEIAAGSHDLTIKVQSKGRAFYLDYLVYTPLPNATFDSAVLVYPNTDPSVSFGSGWSTLGGENGTNVKDAQVALNFHGTSASLYGFVPTELAHNATWATYSIDGDTPVNFTLEGLSSSNSATAYNVLLFTTPTIPNTEHNLVVSYGGDSQHTPLVVGDFYVATASSTTTNSSSSDSSSGPSSPSSSSLATTISKHSPVGAIVGGLLGGVAILALLGLLALFCQRRRRRADDKTSATPFPLSMTEAVGPSSPTAPPHGDPVTYGPAINGAPVTYGTRPLPPSPTAGYEGTQAHRLSPTGAAPPPSAPYTYSSPSSGSAYSAPPGASHAASSRAVPSESEVTYPSIQRVAPLHRHPSDQMSSSSSSYGASLPGGSSQGLPAASSIFAVGSHGSEHHAYDAYAAGAGTLPSPVSSTLPTRLPVPSAAKPLPPPPPTSSRAPGETSKLARERAAAAAWAAPAPQSTNPNLEPLVLRHEDSGLRLQIPGRGPSVLELPPGYSPS